MTYAYNPIWDDAGRLRSGCTLYAAAAWLVSRGNRTPGDLVAVNGKIARLDTITRSPAQYSRPIIKLGTLYYGTLAFWI